MPRRKMRRKRKVSNRVLLVRDVEELGRLGDVVEVEAGYARNYLLAQGLAVVATEANLKSIAKEAAKRAEARVCARKQLEGAASVIEGAEAVIAAKANEQGHLFGSVTVDDIAGNLAEQGLPISTLEIQSWSVRPVIAGPLEVNGPRQPVKLPQELLTEDQRPEVSDVAPARTGLSADGEGKGGDRIKQVGTYQVTLKFAEDLAATVTVVVVPLLWSPAKRSPSQEENTASV